jgi:hypothetical protein
MPSAYSPMHAIIPALPIIFTLFILACAYSAQYWAKKCRDELKEIKEELRRRP